MRIRAIACLMLLHAQPLSRILRLTTSDITHDDGQTWICFGHPPAPVPEPFASLLHQQISAQPASHSDWLFPGRNPGQPAAYGTIFTLLRDRGFPMRTARVSALHQLVLQAPAPVIARSPRLPPHHHPAPARQRRWNLGPLPRPRSREVTPDPQRQQNTHHTNTRARQSSLARTANPSLSSDVSPVALHQRQVAPQQCQHRRWRSGEQGVVGDSHHAAPRATRAGGCPQPGRPGLS